MRRNPLHSPVSRWLILLTLLALGAAADTESGVLFNDFESFYFETERALITNRLAPCGCVYWQALDGLTPPAGGAFSPTVFSTLTQAETLLFTQLRSQLAQCQCAEGESLVDGSAISTAAPGTAGSPIAKSDAEAMMLRVTQVLNNTYDACCDATKSSMEYHFAPGYYTFRAAEGDAPKKGGVLATINSRVDEVNAWSVLQGKQAPTAGEGNNGMFAWIGLRYRGGVLSWASGAAVAYKNFGIGEEGSLADGCVAIAITRWSGTTSGAPGQWNVMDCNVQLPYLLEYRITPETQQRVKQITIGIAVVLGLFLLASIAIVVKKVVSPTCGGGTAAPRLNLRRLAGGARRRRRDEGRTEDQDAPEATEMSTVDTAVAAVEPPQQHPPRQTNQRRRVHFPQPGAGPEQAGGRERYTPRTAADVFARDEDGAARRVRSAAARDGAAAPADQAPSKGLSVAERRLMAARKHQLQQQRLLMMQQQEQLRQRRAAATSSSSSQGASIPPRPGETTVPPPAAARQPSSESSVPSASLELPRPASTGANLSRPATAPPTPDTHSLERHLSNASASDHSEHSVPAFQPLDLGEILMQSPTISPLGFQRPDDPLSFLDEIPPASPDRERTISG